MRTTVGELNWGTGGKSNPSRTSSSRRSRAASGLLRRRAASSRSSSSSASTRTIRRYRSRQSSSRTASRHGRVRAWQARRSWPPGFASILARSAALGGVDLDVGLGDAIGIVGPNGAGKTTLLNVLAGTMAPSAGTVTFRGSDVSRASAARRARLYRGAHQVPRPFGAMTVFENCLVGATAGGGLRRRAAYARCLEVLELCGLIELADRRADSLGLLGRKRLELARALATAPVLLLLDEIGAGLTDAEAAELVAMLKAPQGEQGLAIVWIDTSFTCSSRSLRAWSAWMRAGSSRTASRRQSCVTPASSTHTSGPPRHEPPGARQPDATPRVARGRARHLAGARRGRGARACRRERRRQGRPCYAGSREPTVLPPAGSSSMVGT